MRNLYIGSYRPGRNEFRVTSYDERKKLIADTVERDRLLVVIVEQLSRRMNGEHGKSLREAYK